MLDAVMKPIVFDPLDFDFDVTIPPFGFEFSPWRDYDMIVWKKALVPKEIKTDNDKIGYEHVIVPKVIKTDNDKIGYEHVIVKLKIPKDAAIVFTPTKCRANRAIVLGFYPCELYGEEHELAMTSAMSWYDHSYIYNLGREITPDCFDRDWRRTCSHGIHFFRYFVDAVRYVF